MLFVDDEPDVRKTIKLTLNKAGFTVKEIPADGVFLFTGEQVPTRTVICTVGDAPHPLMAKLSLPQERGKILVEPTMQVKGLKNLWVLGDAALVPDITRGGWCPPTAQYAMRQGRQAARNILAVLHDRPSTNFQFKGLGQMAVVSRHCGVAQIWGLKISGFLAWTLRREVYLMKLPGLRCKVRVALDWIMEIVFPRDITKVEVQRTEQLKRALSKREPHRAERRDRRSNLHPRVRRGRNHSPETGRT